MSIIITGINQELANLGNYFNKKREQVKRESVLIKEDLLRKSRDKAPVLTGALRDSGFADIEDKGVGNGIVITVGFDTPYALRMHESHYRPSHPGTGRKYLQRALDENLPKYKARLEAIGDKK